jgi:hypothetical protein
MRECRKHQYMSCFFEPEPGEQKPSDGMQTVLKEHTKRASAYINASQSRTHRTYWAKRGYGNANTALGPTRPDGGIATRVESHICIASLRMMRDAFRRGAMSAHAGLAFQGAVTVFTNAAAVSGFAACDKS